jgi:putative ABC transport system permease protein
VRRLMKSPMFVTIVALTFALGIGANIAVFSVLNAVVLRPLPYLNATRLVTVGAKDSRRATHPALSILDVDDLRSQTHTLSQIAAGTPDQLTIAAHGRPIALNGIAVMPEYFELLGIRPQLGRNLTPADSRPGEQRLVISDAVWRGDFGADPAVIGRAIVVNGTAMRIVGVFAAGQLLVDPAERKIGPQDYITALPETDRPNQRGSRYLGAVAQIAPSASLASVNAELALVSQRLQKQYPGTDATFTFSAQSMHAAVLGSAASIVWIVFAAVVGILLIACANVGNMLIARWSTRDRELALRRSLGASSSSIARMLLIETGILAVVGAVLGIGLAYAGLRAVGSFALSSLPRGGDVAIDGPALLYAVAIVVVTTFLAALAPIASLNVTDLNSVLKAAGRGGDASARHRSRTSLVVFEIALALALVIVSGLMVRSFIELIRTPLGIRQAGVVVSDFVSLPNNYASLDARAAAQQRVLEQLRSLPGVQTAALGVNYPLGGISLNFDTSVLGKNYPQGEEPSAAGNDVTPGYFRSLGIPLVRGRDFTSNDTAHSLPVVIVNQSFARTVLSDREAIGAKIRIAGWNGTNAHWASVVGVVADTRLALAQAPARSTMCRLPKRHRRSSVRSCMPRVRIPRRSGVKFEPSSHACCRRSKRPTRLRSTISPCRKPCKSARRQRSSACSRSSHCSLPWRGSSAWFRPRSRSAHASSAYVWRWARPRVRYWLTSCVARSRRPLSGSPSASSSRRQRPEQSCRNWAPSRRSIR